MKIAICTTSLKNESQARGIGFYTKRLIKALQKVDKKNQYIFFTRGEKLPKCDLVHYPYFDFFFLTLPLVKSVKTIVTVHDLTPLVFPDKFPKGIKGWVRYLIQKQSLRGADAVMADSENSKRDIVKFIGFPKAKIHVIPLAPEEEFKKLEIKNWKLEIQKKYSFSGRFILYVGDVNWNKNVPGLVKAFYKLRTENLELRTKRLKLVLVGKAFLDENLKESQEINKLIEELDIRDEVLKLGFVPDEDLVKIYNLATVYVQSSFYEGFGLPVLEAMACGTPVVCANTASLPEVAGKAVVYVDPYDIDDIARGISKVLHYNDTYHCKKVEEGLEWAKKFSWERTAGETIKVYEKVGKGAALFTRGHFVS